MKQTRKITNVLFGAGLLLLLCLVFLMSRAAQGPVCVWSPDDLVSWWDGDDVSGTTAFDIQNGNDGTLVGGATTVSGQVGNAFTFSGSGADYVRVSNHASLEPANVTVDAWVKACPSPGSCRYIIAKGAQGCTAASYALYTGGGGLNFYIYNPSYSYKLSPYKDSSVWDGNWHHVAGTYDGEYVRLYVDGAEVGSGTLTTISIGYGLTTDNDFIIGQYKGTCSLPFKGEIDEVEIFDRALSQAEIQAIFDAGSAGKCKPIHVEIDIKPGSYPNAINLGSQGVIPVAVLSSADFDATRVNPDTVELAGSGVAVRGKSDKYMAHEEDVNGDGRIDIVMQVETDNLDPESFQNGYAVLRGITYDGLPFEGSDEITIVPD